MSWSKSFINSSNANRLSLPSADSSGGLFAGKDYKWFQNPISGPMAALQVSGKYTLIPPLAGLRFPDLSRHSLEGDGGSA